MRSITSKVIMIVTFSFFCSLLVISGFIYNNAYVQTKDAVGMEAYGCANITTVLINTDLLHDARGGNVNAQKEIGQQLNWTVDHKHIFDGHYVLDENGVVIAVDSAMIKSGVVLSELHPIDQEVIKQVIETRQPAYSDVYEAYGKERITGLAPIFENHNPNGKIIGISAIDFDAKIITERVWDTLWPIVVLGGISFVITMIITAFVISRFTKSIKKTAQRVEEISNGNLMVDIQTPSRDEIGLLTNDVNELVHKFKYVLQKFVENTNQITATSEAVSNNSKELSHISNVNTDRLEEVKQMAEQQTQLMGEINLIVKSLTDKAQQISEHIQAFSAISNNTVDVSVHGEQLIKDTSMQMHQIDVKIEKLIGTMKALSNKSEEIDKITNLISQISQQTNVLSFNASIEAQRAGEYGKGFSVVAAEIRNLAEQSANSSKQIEDLLCDIRSEIQEAVAESEEGRVETKEGIKKVDQAGETFRNISTGIKEVSNNLAETSASVENFTLELEEIAANLGNILEILDNTSTNTNEVTEAIKEQNHSLNEMVCATEALVDISEKLKQETKYFKLNEGTGV